MTKLRHVHDVKKVQGSEEGSFVGTLFVSDVQARHLSKSLFRNTRALLWISVNARPLYTWQVDDSKKELVCEQGWRHPTATVLVVIMARTRDTGASCARVVQVSQQGRVRHSRHRIPSESLRLAAPLPAHIAFPPPSTASWAHISQIAPHSLMLYCSTNG